VVTLALHRSGDGVLRHTAVGRQESDPGFLRCADGYGATALHITANSPQIKADLLWHDHRLGSTFGNLLLAGDIVLLLAWIHRSRHGS